MSKDKEDCIDLFYERKETAHCASSFFLAGGDTTFYADFENTTGDNNWTFPTTASTGNWEIGNPNPTSYQPDNAYAGSQCMFSGTNTSVGGGDIDGGATVALSPSIVIPSDPGDCVLALYYYFTYDDRVNSNDYFKVEVVEGGTNTVIFHRSDVGNDVNFTASGWKTVTININEYKGKTIKLRMSAADGNDKGAYVEAGFDEVSIINVGCPVPLADGSDDLDGDGVADEKDADDDGDGMSDKIENLQVRYVTKDWTAHGNGVYSATDSASGITTTVTLANYTEFWDHSLGGVGNHNKPGCEEYCTESGEVLSEMQNLQLLVAGNAGSHSSGTCTVSFSNADGPVILEAPRIHILALGGSSHGRFTSSKWILQGGKTFTELCGDLGGNGSTTIEHPQLGEPLPSGLVYDCNSGALNGTVQLNGSHSSFVFDVTMYDENSNATAIRPDGLLFYVEYSSLEVDTDKDGISNHRDSDSDNDGIPDAIEACSGVTHGMLTDCKLPVDNTATDTVSGCKSGITTTPCVAPLNTDSGKATGDTIPDYLDLDSDGDGCSDTEEAFDLGVTGTNKYTYDPVISIVTPSGLTTSKMCGASVTEDEDEDGKSMRVDTGENVCVFRNKDYGDLPASYDVLYARQYADADNNNKPEEVIASWMGGKIDFEENSQSSDNAKADGNDDGLKIISSPLSTGINRTGEWEVTANGNNAGSKVYISLRIDWNNDRKFMDISGTQEIYEDSIVIASPTTKTLTINYPDSYNGLSDTMNVRLVGSNTLENARKERGRLMNGEVEGYQFIPEQVLPLGLSSFVVKAEGIDGLLEWEMRNELKDCSYEIERSNDGYAFERIGRIDGNGSEEGVQRYTYRDRGVGKLYEGNVYYRIAQVGRDGHYDYSDICIVYFGDKQEREISIYPNPVHDELYIDIRGEEGECVMLDMYDMQGNTIMKKEVFQGGGINIKEFRSGVYIVKFTGEKGFVEIRRFLKM